MGYEQRYKKALEIARVYWETDKDNTLDIKAKGTMECLFPELCESEDEKIRKEIVKVFKSLGDGKIPSPINYADIFTWLEKQGEQKPRSWKPTEEQFEALDYAYNSCSDTEIGNYYEGVLGTLIDDLRRFEKQGKQKPAWSYEDEANLNNIIWLCNNCINGSETTWIPSQATKIKHLMETIKERGLPQQKPDWSEEDEKMFDEVINNLHNYIYFYIDCDKHITWLKSLKERMKGE